MSVCWLHVKHLHSHFFIHSFSFSYSSWPMPCPPQISISPDWFPSSMQTRGRYSVASDQPQLHVARYDWVFLLAVSSQTQTVMRLNGDGLRLANCGRCGQRGEIFCRLRCCGNVLVMLYYRLLVLVFNCVFLFSLRLHLLRNTYAYS